MKLLGKYLFEDGQMETFYHNETIGYDFKSYKVSCYKPILFGCKRYYNPDKTKNYIKDFPKIFRAQEDYNYHYMKLSFINKEIYNKEIAEEIASRLCEYLEQEFKVVYSIEDDPEISINFIVSFISFIDGHTLGKSALEWDAFSDKIEDILTDIDVKLPFDSNSCNI